VHTPWDSAQSVVRQARFPTGPCLGEGFGRAYLREGDPGGRQSLGLGASGGWPLGRPPSFGPKAPQDLFGLKAPQDPLTDRPRKRLPSVHAPKKVPDLGGALPPYPSAPWAGPVSRQEGPAFSSGGFPGGARSIQRVSAGGGPSSPTPGAAWRRGGPSIRKNFGRLRFWQASRARLKGTLGAELARRRSVTRDLLRGVSGASGCWVWKGGPASFLVPARRSRPPAAFSSCVLWPASF